MFDLLDAASLPPAGSSWLEAHHRSKLPERRAFCRHLSTLRPSRVLDVGCATGLWLDELDKVLPDDCEFIGIDANGSALGEATQRAEAWSRRSSFRQVDVDASPLELPEADLTLLFNVSLYVRHLDRLLELLARRPGHVALRQYDPATLRFGPMTLDDQAIIETSLHRASDRQDDFKYYDLDRLYSAIDDAPFRQRDISFEFFSRRNPFSSDLDHYLAGTIWWTLKYLPSEAGGRLSAWWEDRRQDPLFPTYIAEIDLCALLA